ncbi:MULTISPECIES: O-antigen polymerase [Providencia]|uniref:O-antigen polymerase n=1 Tax=Providencia TaxID=586 RepID=UPI0015EBA4A7|nr:MULTISPECIES: O-antigen polymerase [unclassified Providencia]QLQ65043.1 oligosaccharide repeat unit polymerase [Providencia rettgeri]URR21246.1 oligosaccharide repeat unit polymerase [Providencia rettgeri]WOB99667.1 O-antigen ligase [Providencia sp. PROV046]
MRFNIFKPKTLLSIGIIIYIFLPFFFHLLYEDNQFQYSFSISDFYVYFPILCYSFALVLIRLNFKLPKIKIKERAANNNILLYLTLPTLFFCYLLFWKINETFGYYNESQILENIINYRIIVERDSALIIMTRNFITTLLIFISTTSWYCYSTSKKKIFRVYIILSLSLFLYISILSGRRIDLVNLILLSSYFLSFNALFNGKKLGLRLDIAAIFSIIFISLVSWYSYFRQSKEVSSSIGDLIYEFVRRFDGVYPNFYYLYNSPLAYDWFYGVTYIRSFLNILPRNLFPWKHENLQMYFNDHLRLWDNSGMDFGNFGEVWVNFGPFSLIMLPIIIYTFKYFLESIYQGVVKKNYVSICIYSYIIYSILYFFSSPIDSTNFMFIIINLFITYILAKLFSSKKNNHE